MKSRGRHSTDSSPKLILFHLSFVRPLEISSPSVQTLFTIHIIKMCRTLRWQRLDIPRDFHLLFLPTRHSLRGFVSSVLKTHDMSSHPELLQPEGLTTVSWLNTCIISESSATWNLFKWNRISNNLDFVVADALCDQSTISSFLVCSKQTAFVWPLFLVKVVLTYLTFLCVLGNLVQLKHFVFRLNTSANRLYLLMN